MTRTECITQVPSGDDKPLAPPMQTLEAVCLSDCNLLCHSSIRKRIHERSNNRLVLLISYVKKKKGTIANENVFMSVL